MKFRSLSPREIAFAPFDGIKLVYFENRKFLPPFYSIARFYKIEYRLKTCGRKKKAASYSASG